MFELQPCLSPQQDAYILKRCGKANLKGSNIAVDWQTKRNAAEFEEGDAIRAQGAMLRELQALLKDKDPGFGGLVRVQNKRREFRWVHPAFVDEY